MTNETPLPHRFVEGQQVVLAVSSYESSQFFPGAVGVIRALYLTEPPSYEVDFLSRDGHEWGGVWSEDQLEDASSARCIDDGKDRCRD
jgi:hypothetical protein